MEIWTNEHEAEYATDQQATIASLESEVAALRNQEHASGMRAVCMYLGVLVSLPTLVVLFWPFVRFTGIEESMILNAYRTNGTAFVIGCDHKIGDPKMESQWHMTESSSGIRKIYRDKADADAAIAKVRKAMEP